MRYLFLLFTFISFTAYSQMNRVTGIISNGETHAPLPSASIFINNSSLGTLSDGDGKFTLGGIPWQSFELVISYTGFTTVSVRVTQENIHRVNLIQLFPRKETLESVSIMVPEKDGWKTWGKFFSESFLGRSDFALQCTITNPKALKFFNDRKHRQLKAYSNSSLIITNKALGYEVQYLLEDFVYDFKTKMITYAGYTGFRELKTRSAKKKLRWEKARKEAFEGSIMHFMRALYKNEVAGQGFDVRKKIRIPNTDTLFPKIYLPGNMPTVRIGDHSYKARAGEIPAFRKIPDYVDLICQDPFSFKEALFFDSSAHQVEFYFDNYIQVTYTRAMVKQDYLLANELPKYLKMYQISSAELVSADPLVIDKDGNYFNPVNLMSSGYWGWYKLAEMLPMDYQP